MSKTQSRYQRGLSYEPGMAENRYRPSRGSADLGDIGDYGGVTPINGDTSGGVVVPQDGGSGNGLGGAGNMLAGLALTALSNPNVIDWASRQLSGTQTGGNALTSLGRPLDSSVGYEFLAGTPASSATEFIQPWAAPITTTTPEGAQITWRMASDAAADGGETVANLVGLGTDAAASLPTWADLGMDLGGGILGNYIVGQTPMEGRRDPTGKQIGAAIGALAGMAIPVPFVGPMLGAIIGGGIGGQFGPMASVGSNWGGMNVWSPDGQGGGGWSYHSGADNGGQVNDPAAQQFQQMLQSYAAQRGYEIDPMSMGGGYTVGQYSGNGPNSPGQGWFYQPWAGPAEGIQRFFGNDLSAQANGGFAMRQDGTMGTYGDAMLGYALSDLIGQGLYVPTGTALTGDALQTALADRSAQQAALGEHLAAVNAVGPQGN